MLGKFISGMAPGTVRRRRPARRAGQNFLKILLAIVRRRRLALPDNILSGTYWQLSGVKQKYFQITRLSCAAGIDAGVYLKNNLNTLVIVRHRRRWRRKAMDSRMTICGDFAEDDANINTEYKAMVSDLRNFYRHSL